MEKCHSLLRGWNGIFSGPILIHCIWRGNSLSPSSYSTSPPVSARRWALDERQTSIPKRGSVANTPMDALVAAVKDGQADRVRELLARNPELKTRLDEPGFGSFDAPAVLTA